MSRPVTEPKKRRVSRKVAAAPENRVPDHEIVVIGAGPSGIGAGVRLLENGLSDFVILEKGASTGGTWRDNTYPGVGVDVPTIGYEFSFDRGKEWTRFFPKGAEVNSYLAGVAHRHKLDPHFRFNVNVLRQVWDEERLLWQLHTETGAVITCRYLLTAVGPFVNPKDPHIPGVEDFKGKIQRASRWDHAYDHAGKRVAVVGTGASGVQIVGAMAPEVGQLTVFQRSPVFCLPKPDFLVTEPIRRVMTATPVAKALDLVILVGADALIQGLVHRAPLPAMKVVAGTLDLVARSLYRGVLWARVDDKALRRSLLPDFGLMVKRPTINNDYLRAYNRDNVDLVTAGIDHITPEGIRTVDGVEHRFDMIVLATGHQVFTDPEYYVEGMVVGRDGADLGELYSREGLQAYESISVPKFPNRFMISGPYSWAHSCYGMTEMLSTHIVRVIAETKLRGGNVVEVRQDAHDAYHARMLDALRNFEWYLGKKNAGVSTYYLNSQGHHAGLRGSTWSKLLLDAKFRPLHAYTVRKVVPGGVTAEAARSEAEVLV